MKILVAPDKFKGSLNSRQAASIICKAFSDKGHQVISSPLADGGEGTVEAIIKVLGGQKKSSVVEDPLGRSITADWGVVDTAGLSRGDCPATNRMGTVPAVNENYPQTAIIEMAAASGLHLLSPSERDPLKTSTFGTGQLIKAALDQKINNIFIGVGGSATNDGGVGAAAALGARFLDSSGRELEPTGFNLPKIHNIDLSQLDNRIKDAEITVAVDVHNPFYGPRGAAFIYGPQKGADKEQVSLLDQGLKHLAAIVKQKLGFDLQAIEGSGAAGGLAGGLVAFLGAKIVAGTQFICKLVDLPNKVKQADLVITAEGRVDEQTLFGKAPSGVINLANKYGKRVIIIAGQLGKGYKKVEDAGARIFTLAKNEEEATECMKNPKPAIERAVEEIISQLEV